MRLPALRLPSFRPSFDWLEGFGGRRTLLYALWTFVLFLICLLANFPHHALVQRVLKSVNLSGQGMRLDVGDTRFAWWRGYELQRVKLAPADPNGLPFLEAASIFVRPGFDGLMRGQINSVHVVSLMYGGQLDGDFSTVDGLRRAMVTIDGVQLQRYPLASSFLDEGVVAGLLSGVISVENRGGDANDTRAAGELGVDKGSITDAKFNFFPLPPLHFDKTTLKFSAQGGRIDVQEFEANGPELKLSISGQIALREPVSDSVLNLKLSAAPGPNSPEEVKNLLGLLPPLPKGGKPDAPRMISGTLARPRFR
jgi:type II secretion system protein N